MRKNGWVLFLFVILGLVAGTLVSHWLNQVPGLSFLTRPLDVSWSPAFDFVAVSFAMTLQVSLTLLSIAGAIAAIWLYRKL
jgi:hypothetical protein